MSSRLSPLALALSLAAPAVAQNYIAFPIDNPTGSTSQNIPFAGGSTSWDEARSQFFIPAAYLPTTGALITGIDFVPAASGTFNYERFEIWMDHTQSSTLSMTFAQNLSATPQLVFSRTPGTINWVGGNWFSLTFDTPFVYDGTSNLVYEVRKKVDRNNPPSGQVSHRILTYPRRADLPTPIWAYGTFGSGAVDAQTATSVYSTQILTRLQVAGANTMVIDSTRDTSSSSTRSYHHLGATITTTIQGPAGGRAFHVIGLPLAPSGIQIPTIQGQLWILPPLVFVYGQGALDPAGRHSAQLTVPNDPGLIGVHVYMQGLAASGTAVVFTNVVDAPLDS